MLPLLLLDQCVGEAIDVLDLESFRKKISDGLRQAVAGYEGRGAAAALRVPERQRGVATHLNNHGRRRGGCCRSLTCLFRIHGQGDKQSDG